MAKLRLIFESMHVVPDGTAQKKQKTLVVYIADEHKPANGGMNRNETWQVIGGEWIAEAGNDN